jgi:hypothetical protein
VNEALHDLRFTRHADIRLCERLRLTQRGVLDILAAQKFVPIGREKNRLHCLFYSIPDQESFVAVIDTKTREVITLLPSHYHNRWRISEETQAHAEDLAYEDRLGTPAWVASHPGQVQPGYCSDDANFTFPDQTLPYSSGRYPFSGSIYVTNYITSTNPTTSATYPIIVPYGGVITNVLSYITTTSWPNKPNTITNCGTSTIKSKTEPQPGSFCGMPWQTGKGSDNNWWYYYPIASYSYPSVTYSYNLLTSSFVVTSSYYDHILYSGDFFLSSPLSGTTNVLGDARLVLPAGINMSGTDSLITSQFGSIQIFAGGNCTIGGNGAVNQRGYARNCELFCTPGVQSINFSGNGQFIGVILAPSSAVTMNGGGSSDNDFIGVLVGQTIRMNGHFSFHYDESLGPDGADGRYIVTGWNELPSEVDF